MRLGKGEEDFIGVVNRLTDTKGRLLSSKRLATKIHEIARQLVNNEASVKFVVEDKRRREVKNWTSILQTSPAL